MISTPRTNLAFSLAMLVMVLTLSQAMVASSSASRPVPDRVTQVINESQTITLHRNTRPEANALKRPRGGPGHHGHRPCVPSAAALSQQERALNKLIDATQRQEVA